MFENWNKFLETEMKRKAERDRQRGGTNDRRGKAGKERIQKGLEPAKPGEGETVSSKLLEPQGSTEQTDRGKE